MKRIFLLLLPLILQACVPAVPASEYAPTSEVLSYPANKKLLSKLQGVDVVVQDAVHGAVAAEEVAKALNDALTHAQYLNPAATGSAYRLKATVIKIDYPALSFDLNVKATIRYELTRSGSANMAFAENVTIGHEIGFFEESDGTERLRKAIAKAISGNITHFLRLLSISKLNA
ncbi:MAG: hypothetical protein K1X79_14070 [Oligoflexia bacterium]|nr:hypothetical protein [Oligoflexia bacterium]